MRAAVVNEDHTLRIDDVAIAPEPGELLVRVRACGICGTDLHALQHPDTFDTRPGDVLGHEFCGEIVDATDGVDGWDPGDRVVVQPILPCGACEDCTDGYRSRCRRGRGFGLGRGAVPGAYAEFARVSPHALYRIPDHVSDRAAALTEPFAVGIHAVRRTRVQAGDACLIMGGGPVGVFTLLAAQRAGAGPIVVSDFAEGRRQLCERLGAAAVVDPATADPGHVLRDLTGVPPPVRVRRRRHTPNPAGGDPAGRPATAASASSGCARSRTRCSRSRRSSKTWTCTTPGLGPTPTSRKPWTASPPARCPSMRSSRT